MNTRRQFLKQASMLAVTSLLPSGFVKAISKSDKFALGVASGDAMSDSVILWTYYEGFYPLKVCVWTEDRKGIWADAIRGDGGFVQMEIKGLSPYTRYRYAFSEMSFDGQPIAQSVVGYFRTAPTSDALISMKFGASSCVKYLFEPTILEEAAKQDLDFFIHNGDNSYNDGMTTTDEYRGRWKTTLSKPGCLNLRRSMSMISTMDDHEIADDFDMESIAPKAYQIGRQSFFEHMPLRRNLDYPDRIWRKLSWGRTLDVFVLDCRSERLPSQNQYISRAQMDWLKSSLSESTAMFKIIMNSVPITEYPMWFLMKHDRWQGYPEQRTEILEHIDSAQIKNLLWVSGDFHFGSYGRVSVSGPGATQMEVLAGPGAQRPNFLGGPLRAYSQFDWLHFRNNYITIHCDVDSEKMEVVPHLLE
ncbi:MAG: alkaline phosphatase D family protein [Myxococcaceae bacterium]